MLDHSFSAGCPCPACAQAAAALTAEHALSPQAAIAQNAPITGSNSIDALLAGADYRWNDGSAYGTGLTVTYSFMTQAPSYADSSDRFGFAPMTTAERTAVKQALDLWSSVANISFREVADTGAGGQIRLGTNNQGSVSAAYTYFADKSDPEGGDVYLNNRSSSNNSPTPGTYGFATILHELGHALGLKHPGNYNAGEAAGTGGIAPYLPAATDDTAHSVMSYNDVPSGIDPVTPMLYDVTALQFLYGTNTTTRAGNDVYQLTDTAVLQTIWDGGGSDLLDASQLTTAARLDLTPGTLSDYGRQNGTPVRNDLGIALNVTIENAIGGRGSDTIQGNGGDNIINGGAGDDSLFGGDGNDILGGSIGNDVLDAGNGSLNGLFGEAGNDTLVGGTGTDNMLGGTGADVFVEHGNGSVDGIFDFNRAEGDRIRIDFNINNSGLTTPAVQLQLTFSDGQNSFVYLGKGAGGDQWIIVVGVPAMQAGDFLFQT